jgi:hypothetical protein
MLSLGLTMPDIYLLVRRFIDGVFEDYLSKSRKERWIDKTPAYYSLIPFVEAVFNGSAQYILLVRHPLDCICSLDEFIPLWPQPDDPDVRRLVTIYGRGRYALAKYWVEVNERIAYSLSALEKRAFLVRYEDLVRDPSREMKRILTFLGEDPTLLHLRSALWRPRTPGYQDPKILHTRSVHTNSVGRYRTLPEGELDALWNLVAAVAQRFGYDRSDCMQRDHP